MAHYVEVTVNIPRIPMAMAMLGFVSSVTLNFSGTAAATMQWSVPISQWTSSGQYLDTRGLT